MIRINVAPEIALSYDPLALVKIAVPIVLLAALGFYATMYYSDMKTQEAEEIRAKLEEKKGQLAKLKLDVDKVKSLQARLQELKNRADRIRSLSAGRKQPVLLLDTLQAQHLERMWFGSLALDGEDATLEAFALDHAVIAEYVRRLKLNLGEASSDSTALKDFVPPFMRQDTGVKAEVERTQSVSPLKLTNVTLIKSTAGTQDNVLVQTFKVTFKANTK